MKKRLLWVAFLIVFSFAAHAQEYTIRLTTTYSKGTEIEEEAVETILSSGSISDGARVTYKAGRSVLLEPGFRVEPGGQFVAQIEPVRASDIATLAVRVFPNPVQRVATIEYDLPRGSHVTLGIYDMNGRLVKLLRQEKKEAGRHQELWDSSDVSGGAYIYTLKAGDKMKSGRVIKQ